MTHEVSLDDKLNTDQNSDFFKVDPDFEKNEKEWDEIKGEILGMEAERINKMAGMLIDGEQVDSSDSDDSEVVKIEDNTE